MPTDTHAASIHELLGNDDSWTKQPGTARLLKAH